MADANSSERVPSLANLVPTPGVENVARVKPDEDISPHDARVSGPGEVRKSPGVTLADLGDVEGFGRKEEEDQLYAFQLAGGVYKRKDGIISSDGATSMEANLDLGCNTITNLKYPDWALFFGLKGEWPMGEESLAHCAVPAGVIQRIVRELEEFTDQRYVVVMTQINELITSVNSLADSGVPGPAGALKADLDMGGFRITNLKYPDHDLFDCLQGFWRGEEESLARCAVPAGTIKERMDALVTYTEGAYFATKIAQSRANEAYALAQSGVPGPPGPAGDSQVRMHQVTTTIVGFRTEEPEWLDVVPLGKKED
ncbi:MAG: hypothetical protein AB2556_09390 [Candidatus Thiodiazotropha sp.]